jgi:hypothetical protein
MVMVFPVTGAAKQEILFDLRGDRVAVLREGSMPSSARVALITGCGKPVGIGNSTARALADRKSVV